MTRPSAATELARVAAARADSDWSAHRQDCIQCAVTSARRSWHLLCPVGTELRDLSAEARAEVRRQADLDAAPSADQDALW